MSQKRKSLFRLFDARDIAEETQTGFDSTRRIHYAIAGAEVIHMAAKAIKNAKRPLLLLVPEQIKEARRAISEFIGMIGVPFRNTQMGGRR